MSLCETCKHFAPDEPFGFGSCERWNQGYGLKVNDMAENEVLVENDEGWGMVVGPKFGCVLHEGE